MSEPDNLNGRTEQGVGSPTSGITVADMEALLAADVPPPDEAVELRVEAMVMAAFERLRGGMPTTRSTHATSKMALSTGTTRSAQTPEQVGGSRQLREAKLTERPVSVFRRRMGWAASFATGTVGITLLILLSVVMS
ncbi:MAG: hypothetical protein M3014_12115, partial [Chloroflexota bacterium]|nr:hypothetical protein [Chloroflexota bacterium]